MRHKNTAFYRGNTRVSVDFSAEEISSDGAVVLLEKLESGFCISSGCDLDLPVVFKPFLVQMNNGDYLTRLRKNNLVFYYY